jgi:hypothetical protein
MRWMVLILGLSLSGCYAPYQGRYQAQGPPPLQSTSMEQVNAMAGVQQPAAYKVGFMAGCDSGRLSAGDSSFLFKKDTNRFDTDDAYKQGWNDGFKRCASGEGATAGNYNYQGYYDYYYPYGYNSYYPGTFSSGFYYPSYYYAPGYSLWLGGYGYPRHYAYRNNYYYTPWYGGYGHRGGGKYYSGRGGHRGYGGGSYLRKPYRGGHGKSYRGRGGKGGGHRGGGRRGGGHRGGGRSGGGRSGGGHSGGSLWIR